MNSGQLTKLQTSGINSLERLPINDNAYMQKNLLNHSKSMHGFNSNFSTTQSAFGLKKHQLETASSRNLQLLQGRQTAAPGYSRQKIISRPIAATLF